MTVSAAVPVWAVTQGLGFQWLELELGRSACTAAGPIARPLTFPFGWLLLAAFTARIIDACSERARKVQVGAASTAAAATGVRVAEPAATV